MRKLRYLFIISTRSVEYILFEDEGHGFVKLNNRLYMYPRIIEFLDKYLKP
jgi:dipeptidyl aminopeptidase/acylaminoacyl peptidase